MKPVIEVSGLSKRYGDFVALRDLSFQVDRGEVVGFLGPNGAGKSTTMKILTGYLSPSTGRAEILGLDVVADSLEARSRVGYLPESNPLYPEMQVEEYLRFVAEVRGLGGGESARSVLRALERTGLVDRRGQTIGTLSKGYRQRVGLAQAILHEPDLLILDEPTSGLDPNQLKEIRGLIRELGKEKTILLSTHILQEVRASCDRVLILHEGSLVADGPTEELVLTQEGLWTSLILTRGAVERSPESVVQALEGLSAVLKVRLVPEASEPGALHLRILSERDVRADLFREVVDLGMVLLEMRLEVMELEDVFARLTGAQR